MPRSVTNFLFPVFGLFSTEFLSSQRFRKKKRNQNVFQSDATILKITNTYVHGLYPSTNHLPSTTRGYRIEMKLHVRNCLGGNKKSCR